MTIEHVHFFCEPPEGDGLVSPRETPEGYCAWGDFYVPATADGGLSERYAFPTIRNGHELTFALIRKYDEFLVARIPKVGVFEFGAERVCDRYIGKLFPDHSETRWFILRPMDDRKLEDACTEHNFCFVGLRPPEDELP